MYNKILENFKENKKTIIRDIIVIALTIFIGMYELNYEVYTWGKAINVDDVIEVKNEYESKGSLNITYVRAYKGTILTTLMSKVIPSWDLVKASDIRLDGETIEDELKRGRIDLETTNEYALKNALEKANISYKEKDKEIIVYHVFKEANTNLEVGDIIRKIDNIDINSKEDIKGALENKKVDDEILIEVENSKKKVNKTAKVIEIDNQKLIGIYLVPKIKIETDKEIDFKFDKTESGSSAGLMTALSIYNKLVKEDITKGKKISGTGTIDYEGNVGEIGGLKYKIKGAVKSESDIFLVPSGENYEEAKKIVEDSKYKIKLIEISTFEEAISKLKDI